MAIRLSSLCITAAAFTLLSCASVYSKDVPEQNARTEADTYKQLNLFGEVFERVRNDYVEEKKDQELIEAAINGMLTYLDPHSSYLDLDSFKDMQVQTKGEFGGLGIEVTQENGLVKVVSPIDDTPAARAGIKTGDYITHLDGEPVVGLTLNQAVDMMRGLVNTKIKLTIRREGKEAFDVELIRDVIKIKSVRFNREGDIGYIRITAFNENTESALRDAVANLKKDIGKNLKGYVLDLRNNPGGLLEQAVSVSDDFLEKGEIVSTRGRRVEETQRYNAEEGDIADNLPLVVIINGGSASASEIVSGALQDHRRAIVLGTRSFGKGSVQTIIPLPGHGAMRLTTARYYTPSGRSIQAKGIEPDIIVPQSKIETLENGERERHEADLRGALKNPQSVEPEKEKQLKENKKDKPLPAPSTTNTLEKKEGDKKDAKAEDYQLSRALDLLNGIALYEQRRTDSKTKPVSQ
jgi:carboxyl-terminal processing protease